ncbi:YfcC family protein [Ferruginibacter yonginensis]|uniref:YfcC family protein n=1 Tax=Ferruginibacter yonginensis TaxID=1310416 RepID=A0ABV8QPH6_9BACT
MKRFKLPSPISILMVVIIIAAICTWLIPAGKFDTIAYNSDTNTFIINQSGKDQTVAFTQTALDSLHIKVPLQNFSNGGIKKPLSIPGTYHTLPTNKQGFVAVLQAPIKGIYDSVDIVFFVLFIGAFMQIFNQSGAMEKGLASLSYTMKGREAWLIIILTFLFAFAGASYGMAEEGLVFYAILVPIFLTAGYDLIVPVAVIFGGTQLGTLASFTNPFSTIIASNAAGINWTDGLAERTIMFVVTTVVFIAYVIRYANKIKKDPTQSWVYKIDGPTAHSFQKMDVTSTAPASLGIKNSMLLLLFLATFLGMIAGVIWFDWWLKEMTALFFLSAIIVAIILKMKETAVIKNFIEGAQSLLSVALIIGVARGVTTVLNEGNISDTIVQYASNAISGMPPSLFIVMMLLMFVMFTLFISSSSGMAVLTMPIMGALAVVANVPGREIVNAYLFGMGIMGFITPTGLILPSLALVNVSIKAWFKFITPVLLILITLCIICLLVGIHWR